MNFQTAAAVIAVAWIAVWAVLQLEHAMWSGVDFRLRYILGLGTVCAGCLGAGIALDDVALAVVPGVLATAGLPILLSYAREEKAAHDQQAAQKRGEVVGMAKGLHKALTQELIDRGDDPTRN
jgi:uncharacterized membrane protein YfcA